MSEVPPLWKVNYNHDGVISYAYIRAATALRAKNACIRCLGVDVVVTGVFLASMKP